MIETVAPPRGVDAWGDGAYGARRGKRTHKGIDYAAWPESIVLAKTAGTVTKFGYPYPPDDPVKGFLRYVQITDDKNNLVRYFYVKPMCCLNDIIKPRQPVGFVQDLRQAYDARMTPHVHLEVMTPEGEYIDPRLYFEDGRS